MLECWKTSVASTPHTWKHQLFKTPHILPLSHGSPWVVYYLGPLVMFSLKRDHYILYLFFKYRKYVLYTLASVLFFYFYSLYWKRNVQNNCQFKYSRSMKLGYMTQF